MFNVRELSCSIEECARLFSRGLVLLCAAHRQLLLVTCTWLPCSTAGVKAFTSESQAPSGMKQMPDGGHSFTFTRSFCTFFGRLIRTSSHRRQTERSLCLADHIMCRPPNIRSLTAIQIQHGAESSVQIATDSEEPCPPLPALLVVGQDIFPSMWPWPLICFACRSSLSDPALALRFVQFRPRFVGDGHANNDLQ